MPQNLSRGTRLTVLLLVLVAAVFMVAVEPFVVKPMLDKVQVAQIARYEKFLAEGNPQAPLIKPTPALTGWTYPLYMSLSMFAGVVLLVTARPFWDGAPWARALALLCLSIPSIGGAYMLVPYLNFVKKGFPPALIIMAFGLIPYFAVVLANREDWRQKAWDFWIFLMLGVTAAEAWSNGHAAHRILLGHPAMPRYAEGIFILQPARNVSWIAAIALVAAIYLLALRRESGWYTALAGGLAASIIGFATQTVRTATWDYFYQGLMGLAIVIPLLLPAVKRRMVQAEPGGGAGARAAVVAR